MLSLDEYYEKKLKNQPIDRIMSTIKGLKARNGRLIKDVEFSSYLNDDVKYLLDEINMNKKYLMLAKGVLAELGSTYKLSKKEQKALEFQNRINEIESIQLFINKSNNMIYDIELVFEGDDIHTCIGDKKYVHCNAKKDFLNNLTFLCLGEWQDSYSVSDYDIICMDGEHWHLYIQYNDDQVDINGFNVYPYNFNEFKALIDRYSEI